MDTLIVTAIDFALSTNSLLLPQGSPQGTTLEPAEQLELQSTYSEAEQTLEAGRQASPSNQLTFLFFLVFIFIHSIMWPPHNLASQDEP